MNKYLLPEVSNCKKIEINNSMTTFAMSAAKERL